MEWLKRDDYSKLVHGLPDRFMTLKEKKFLRSNRRGIEKQVILEPGGNIFWLLIGIREAANILIEFRLTALPCIFSPSV